MNIVGAKLEIIDSLGRLIPLGVVLGKGGEGTVYEVKQSNSTVAKIYHRPLSPERTEKIRTMANMRTEGLGKLTSWPVDLLAMKHTRQPIGLLMPRIANRKNVHHLYGPKSRLQDFPRADWRFLVRAATNVARAFAVVHEANCVIGDVNHGSIMVAEDATVSLIDCDSFQVNTPTRRFLCEVGIETFTPPELQGIPYGSVVRTPNYDNFGLAVMVFHLLFMGRHPFAGRYSGLGEMPIAKAIKECRFPYGSNSKASQMERPPGTPALAFVGADVASLFETAFSYSTKLGGRPTARDWTAVLLKLENNTKRCTNNEGHWYPSQGSSCPWCEMEQKGANPLFPFVITLVPGRSGPILDTDGLWRQIQGLSVLGPAPAIPTPHATPSREAIQVGGPNPMAHPIAVILGLTVFFGGTFLLPPIFWIFAIAGFAAYSFVLNQLSNDQNAMRFKSILSEAEANFNRANSDWTNRAGERDFNEKKNKFILLKAELNEIPTKRVRAFEQLKQNQRKLQLDNFLDKFELEDAKIESVGPGRKRTLESYGIETAKDLVHNKINSVPGFGPKMVDRLMKWRKSIEAKFVFDPAKAIDPRDIAKVEQDILSLRIKTVSATKLAFSESMQAHARILAFRQNMRPQMDALKLTVARAQADYEFVRG